MKEQKPTVFILIGDAEVAGSLRALMESVQLSVKVYSSATGALADLDAPRPGCLILDVRMPRMSGIEFCRRLRKAGATRPAIFVTSHGDVPTAVQAMREGAFDFLQRPFSEQYLLDRVHAAIEKDMHDRRRVLEQQVMTARFASLSAKERQVAEMIIEGRTSRTIASELGVGLKTVGFHRAHIMRKVGVETVAELVCLSFRGGYGVVTPTVAPCSDRAMPGDAPSASTRAPRRTLTKRRTERPLMGCGRRA